MTIDRREFLKILVSLGVAIPLLPDIAGASSDDIDLAWSAASHGWDVFEVDQAGTLSYANFEEPRTRLEAYGYEGASDIDADEIERRGSLCGDVKRAYRHLLADSEQLRNTAGLSVSASEEELEDFVEEQWYDWVLEASGDDRRKIDAVISAWLNDAPDWSEEWEDMYKVGTAQGAAYQYFLCSDFEFLEALGVVVVEGEHPGSSYYAAELRIPPEKANQIAVDKGWHIRFVPERRA